MIKLFPLMLCAYAPLALSQSAPSCDEFKRITVRIEAAETGSGVVMAVNGRTAWIATAAHVVAGGSSIKVAFAGNAAKVFLATLRYPDSKNNFASLDVAVLEVDLGAGGPNIIPASRWRDSSLAIGDLVSYVGNPGALTWQCYPNLQKISRLSYHEDDRHFLFTGQARPGVSGGPIFDGAGNLIGIVRAEEAGRGDVDAIRISSVRRIMVDDLNVTLPSASPVSNTVSQCADVCTVKIGDLKLIQQYTYDGPTNSRMKYDEKVYRFPPTWPIGPYFHAVNQKMDYGAAGAAGKRTPQQLEQLNARLPNLPPQLHIAATDRQGDSDFSLFLTGSTGSGTITGRDGVVYQAKLYGTGEIESYTLEIRPSGSIPANPLLK